LSYAKAHSRTTGRSPKQKRDSTQGKAKPRFVAYYKVFRPLLRLPSAFLPPIRQVFAFFVFFLLL
jgi:hypothetical protein